MLAFASILIFFSQIFLSPDFSSLGSIKGKVVDQTGVVVQGAQITLETDSQSPLARIQSDNLGEFSFEQLTAADYIVVIVKTGFQQQTRRVRLEPAQTFFLGSCQLEIANVLETVTVTPTRGQGEPVFQTVESVSVLGHQEMSRRTSNILPQALRDAPGVHVQHTTTSQGSIFLRGLTGQQVVSLMDGTRFNNSTFRPGANQYTAFVDPSFVEQVEIVRGPNSTEYGSDSMGGTINFLTGNIAPTGSSSTLHGHLNVFFGSADFAAGGNARIGGGARRWGFVAEGTGRKIHDLRPGGGIDSHSVVTRLFGISSKVLGDRLQDTGYTQYGAHGKFLFSLSEFNTLSAEYLRGSQLGARRYDQLNGGQGNLLNRFDPQLLDFFVTRFARNATGRLNSLWATISFNGQRDDRTSQNINNASAGLRSKITEEDNGVQVLGYQGQGTLDLGGNNLLTFGSEFYDEFITSRRIDSNFNKQSGTFSDQTHVRARFPNGSRYQTLGLFIRDTTPLIAQRLKGTFGLRFSKFRFRQSAANNPLTKSGAPTVPTFETSFHDITFNSGLVYSVNQQLNFTASISRGFRAPNVNDFAAVGLSGNGFEISSEEGTRIGGYVGSFDPNSPKSRSPIEQLNAEKLFSYELSVRLRTSRFSGSAIFFDSEIRDFIERRAVIVTSPAVGMVVGGETVIRQDANGFIYTALSSAPVFVRANAKRMRMRGLESWLTLSINRSLAINANGFFVRGTDLETGLPPSLENGIPPATGFVGIRWAPAGRRFWFEAYSNFAAAHRRFSDNDFQQARIGGIRTREEIANFFNNGAVARELVRNGILLPTGETLKQVQNRVLGPQAQAPLFTYNPGFASFNIRGGYGLGERSSLILILENIFDANYRSMGSGVDAPGINLTVRYSMNF